MEIADIHMEFKSDDNTVPFDCACAVWARHMIEAAAIGGRPLDSPLFYKQQLADAGFTNIVQTIYKWPSSPWPRDRKYKDMGRLPRCPPRMP